MNHAVGLLISYLTQPKEINGIPVVQGLPIIGNLHQLISLKGDAERRLPKMPNNLKPILFEI